jgi:hypothetical protein
VPGPIHTQNADRQRERRDRDTTCSTLEKNLFSLYAPSLRPKKKHAQNTQIIRDCALIISKALDSLSIFITADDGSWFTRGGVEEAEGETAKRGSRNNI